MRLEGDFSERNMAFRMAAEHPYTEAVGLACIAFGRLINRGALRLLISAHVDGH